MHDDNHEVAEPKKRSGCITALSGFVVAVSLVPLLIFIASQFGRAAFVCELITNFQLFILIGLLPFPFILLLLRQWWWAVVMGSATLFSLIMVGSVYWPAVQPPKGPKQIRVMSYNVLGANRSYDKVVDVIKTADPDVLVVAEYSRPWREALFLLDEDYPYSVKVPRFHGFGIALFSKLPIKNKRVVQLSNSVTDNPAIIAEVEVDGQVLRVSGIHVLSPTNSERMIVRNQQFREIADELAASNVPTILVGDFNCTVWSPFLKDLMKTARLFDSRRGFGYQATWSEKYWPFQIPIDHVLVSSRIHVHSREVGQESAGSDHYPIICDISISPEK